MNPLPPCSDLTVPVEGSDTVHRLLSRYLALQYRDLLRLRAPEGMAVGSALGAVQRHCRDLPKNQRGALFAALRRPTVGGLVRYLASGGVASSRSADWARQLTATLYAELALSGAAPPQVEISPAPARLLLLGANALVTLPAGTTSATLNAEGLTAAGAGTPVSESWSEIASGRSALYTRAQSPVRGSLALALADDSPLVDQETHPDKEGNRLNLGGHEPEQWVAALRKGLDLVRAGLPALADEIELLIAQIVPVGFSEEQHLSASYQEYIGTIYLSLHPQPITLAEALIHETSHNKINMLWSLAPVLDNAFSPLYPSPFRPDERPLHGVLLGVHAFLPVERLYQRLSESAHPITADPNFSRRRSEIRKRNAAACDTLQRYAQPSPSGTSVLEEIHAWNEHFESLEVAA